jgi:aminomethyltransferase
LNDPVLARIGENHFWLAAASSDILLWVKGVALNSGMDVEVREPDVSPMQIQGPKSKLVMGRLFGDKVLDLKYYSCMEAEVDGIPVVVTRTGWTGEVGYEIYLRDGRRGTELWERVMAAGRPYNIRPTAPNDIRRIEAGILNFGSDMTLEDTPYHVGLDWLVNLEQEADFIGKDALRELQRTGVDRQLVGVEIHGEPLGGWPESYWPIQQNGAEIGELRAAVYSPGLEKNIGYAMLPIAQTTLGTKLKVETPWGLAEATVVPKPFIDPKKDIPKS